MKKGNILFLTLVVFTIVAFPYQASFSGPSVDQRFPKEQTARLPVAGGQSYNRIYLSNQTVSAFSQALKLRSLKPGA